MSEAQVLSVTTSFGVVTLGVKRSPKPGHVTLVMSSMFNNQTHEIPARDLQAFLQHAGAVCEASHG